MEQEKKKHLGNLLNHLNYYNKMAPFPPYDTEYVQKVKEEYEKIEEESSIDYDSLPVEACKYCKSLHIVIDEDDNDICFRCGTINQLQSFNNIHEYNKYLDEYGKTE